MRFLAFDMPPAEDTDSGEARLYDATAPDGAAVAWAEDMDSGNEDIARGNSTPTVWIIAEGEPVAKATGYKIEGKIAFTYTARVSR